jgi:peptide/nickel transport system substrate-binding protein
VRCDSRRARFARIESAELLGEHTIRFVFAEPYFLALSTFDDDLTILPAHRYDLTDPDHPAHDPDADASAQAEHVNRHPGNRDWIGLGPYRLERLEPDTIVARRFDGYFDPARGGFLDEIRWRHFAGAEAAERALLEGELDFYDRLSSADYRAGLSELPEFRARCIKGLYVTPYFGYVAWNVQRPELADARVRRALAASFDWESWIADFYDGLAFRVTGEQFAGSPNYDRELAPVPYDPRAAEALLVEAGWYDRDGDGVADRDGRPLSIELLSPAGNAASAAFGLAFQEQLAAVGVRLELVELEWATLSERLSARDFDAVGLGLTLDLENDPEQLWHSRGADVPSSNRSGLADPEVDRLIEAIQVELDDARRAELFHALQRRVHELQPFLFGVTVARRFALARRVRNVELFALEPGYALRRWAVVDAAD